MNVKLKPDQVAILAKLLRDGIEANRLKVAAALGLEPLRTAWNETRAVADVFLEALEDPEGGTIVIPRDQPGASRGHPSP